MPSSVRCVVEDCVYNESRHCRAESILVKVVGNGIVGTPRGTCCDTFSLKPTHPPDHD